MTEHLWLNAIASLLSILGIWALIFWPVRQSRTDLFRQRMFILRDELFDAAADGLISFDHPAYGILRSTMNGFIRHAHRPAFWQIVLVLLLLRKELFATEDHFEKAYLQAVRDLPQEIKEKLDQYRQRMSKLMVWYIFFGQPESIIFTLLAIIGIVGYIIWRFIRALFLHQSRAILDDLSINKEIGKIDGTALILGK